MSFCTLAARGIFGERFVKITYLLLACILFAGGCAAPKKWYHSSKGQSEFNQDIYRCQQEAAQSYPPAMVQRVTSPGVNVPDNRQVQTNCVPVGNTFQCNSSRTGANASIYNTPPSVVTEDANAANRAYATQSCMFAKDYRLQ